MSVESCPNPGTILKKRSRTEFPVGVFGDYVQYISKEKNDHLINTHGMVQEVKAQRNGLEDYDTSILLLETGNKCSCWEKWNRWHTCWLVTACRNNETKYVSQLRDQILTKQTHKSELWKKFEPVCWSATLKSPCNEECKISCTHSVIIPFKLFRSNV